MWTVVSWLVILAVLAAVAAVGAVLVKAYLSGTSPAEVFFKPRVEPRIGVIEQASMDGKRKLVLIRRDDIEHLLLTGGPVDVVIETGIREPTKREVDSSPQPVQSPPATVFSRAPRAFSTAAATSSLEDGETALKR